MAGDLTNILRDIVSKAANASNGSTGDVARMRKRFEGASQKKVALVDVSSSMSSLIGSSDIPKIEHCRIALTDLMTSHPDLIIIAFGSMVRRLKNLKELPDANHLWGGTDLTCAIEEAQQLKPARTIIISDGCPDNEQTASDAAENLTGRIDCVYCGPDGHPAVAYLQSLARKGGGRQMTFDGCLELSPMIRGLLGA